MFRRRRSLPHDPPKALLPQDGSRPLSVYLWALIICSVLPLLCFEAYTVTRSARTESLLAEYQAEQITHAIADLMDRELIELQASLGVLADAPALRRRDLHEFYLLGRDFANRNDSGVVLLALNGQQLVNTRLEWGTALPAGANSVAIHQVLRTGQPEVVDAFTAILDHKMRVGIAMPVVIDGRIAYVLLATWTLDDVAAKLSAANLPAGWPATVLDSNGIRLWRTPHAELRGKPVDPAFFRKLNSARTQRTESVPDGEQALVVNFTSRLTRAHWIAMVGVPKVALQAPFERSIALLSGAGLLTLLLSLFAANRISGKVKHEVQAVATAAELFDQGRQPPQRRLHIRELRQLDATVAASGIRRQRAEAALRASEERWKFALEGSGDGLWDWNVQTGAAIFSAHWCEMLGLAEHEIGPHVRHWMRRIHPHDLPRVRARLEDYLSGGGETARIEYRMRHKNGSWRWIVSRGTLAARTEDGRPLRLIGTNTDIHERKGMEEELLRLATTDFLTGLANRRSFFARLDEELARLQRREDVPATVLMLDLDHFKRINDNHGHAAGDAMLRHFAALLREGPRKVDLVSRLGGEEFAILLVGTTPETARLVAERLCEWVARNPLVYQDQSLALTVSIGIAAMRASDQTAAAALSRADAALYRAKKSGRNRVEIAGDDEAQRPPRRSD